MTVAIQWVSAAGYRLIAPEEFARFGLDEVAYVRVMRTDDLKRLYGAQFPSVMEIVSGTVHALMSAEGEPLVLGNSMASVQESARKQGLALVALQ